MSTEAETQAIPRVSAVATPAVAVPAVPAAIIAAPPTKTDAPEPEVRDGVPAPDAETTAPGTEPAIAEEASVEHIYAATMARLDAWHDTWTAATAELREPRAESERGEAAA